MRALLWCHSLGRALNWRTGSLPVRMWPHHCHSGSYAIFLLSVLKYILVRSNEHSMVWPLNISQESTGPKVGHCPVVLLGNGRRG